MRPRYTKWMSAAAAMALAACRGDKPVEDTANQTVIDTTQAPRAVLTLAPLDPVAWNQEDTLVVTLANRTAGPLEGSRIQLVVQGGVTVLPGAPGAPVVDSADGGTRVTWELGTVAQGAAVEVRQMVRTPPAPLGGTNAAPAYLVRATLLSRAGTPLLPSVVDTLRVRAGTETAAGGCASAGSATAQRYGIGPVRLGMKGAALRDACPEAHDTTWQAEGISQTGLVVSIAGRPVIAQLTGDSVSVIRVVSPEIRTAAGVGIGVTVGDLRTRYGRLCAGMGEGVLAVWSPNAPGVSFGLDPREPAGALASADSLPDPMLVSSLWIHGKDTPCPAQPEGNR